MTMQYDDAFSPRTTSIRSLHTLQRWRKDVYQMTFTTDSSHTNKEVLGLSHVFTHPMHEKETMTMTRMRMKVKDDDNEGGWFQPSLEQSAHSLRDPSQLLPSAVIIPAVLTLGLLFSVACVAHANGFPIVGSLADSTSALTTQLFDPSTFQPVCPASDGFYQVMKTIANTLIGSENVIEYGPLVASVLLRVRLELCVFESFVYEAVIPFIKQKGISWILPLHETLETFLAGTIFAVASNFILLGSTKIITIILIYIDALIGFPARFLGSLMSRFTKEKGKRKTGLSIFGELLKFGGDVFGAFRRSVEAFDTFVGRYLVFGTTAYIIFKFLHFKVFSGFPF